jgi:cyclin-dependent kinase 7
VGQFKDGLDMSAVREVKYLRELHHPNIIEVRTSVHKRSSPDSLSFVSFVSCLRVRALFLYRLVFSKLLDVFSSKTNLNLVLEFLDTDLEMIIKDRSLVFLPADIKSWVAMTFRGLEFCHRNFILHRVRTVWSFLPVTASAFHISHLLFYFI